MTTTDPTLRMVPLDLVEAFVTGDTDFITSWLDDGKKVDETWDTLDGKARDITMLSP